MILQTVSFTDSSRSRFYIGCKNIKREKYTENRKVNKPTPRGAKMSEIKFNVKEEDEYSILSFEIEGVISPEDLDALTPPKVNGSKGVILSGRGPIWIYCFLTHFYHPTKFIATFDPRLGGAVIVETHSSAYVIGSILNFSQDSWEESS